MARVFNLSGILRGFIAFGLFSLLAFGVIDIGVMPFIAGGFKKTVQVPDLISITPEEAKEVLSQQGLQMALDTNAEYSQEVEAGKVIKSRPVPGSEVKRGRRVWVTVSKGLKRLELPDFKGFSIRQCEITLQQMGLKLGEVRWNKNSRIPAGVIYGSEPGPGTTVEPYSRIHLLVSSGLSSGPEGFPKLTGLSLTKAKNRLEEANIPLGKVVYRKTTEKLPNTVLEQNPSPGMPIKAGVSVNLVVTE